MIRQQKLEALVLSRRKVGEADRLVSLFTREHGVVRAVAKGVRKIPSNRGGHLEPFTQVLAIVHTSRGVPGGRQTGTYISGTETQEYFSALHIDEQALAHARCMTSLVVTLLGEEDPHPRIYDLLRYSWQVLPNLSVAKRNQLETAATVMLLSAAGLLPSWRECEQCGQSTPTDSVILDPAGGWKCITCHTAFVGTKWSLPPRLFKVLRYVSNKPETALRLVMTDAESSLLLQSLRTFTSSMLQQSQHA